MSDKYTVMSIDDSASVRSIVAKFLAESEFELVASLSDGKEAVEKYKTLRPSIVILDVVMPILSGREVLKGIMEADPHARVGMVSSLGTEAVLHECLKSGAISFLQKPFRREGLLEFLRNLIAVKGNG